MYPLKLSPAMKDYIWGGTKLKENWNKKSDLPKIAESWELSLFPGAESVVTNGKEAGRKLADVIKDNPSYLGAKCAGFDRFPILIKLIDATNDLSIQVHPSDAYALAHENELGKTEMWYVAEAQEGSALYYGFNKDMTREELKASIEANTICDCLNKVPVKAGDVLFVEAGTVHAILGGVTVIEIQENSSITYRLYDYDRRDAKGNPRELHISKALEVTDLKKKPLPVTPTLVHKEVGYEVRPLAKCGYFDVSEVSVKGIYPIYNKDSFISFTVADGAAIMADGTKVQKGDTVFIPAGLKLELMGETKIILTTL